MISPANTKIGLTKEAGQGEPDIYYPTKVRNYFRVVPADDLQGPAGAEFMKSLNIKKVYVIDDSQAYGVGLAKAFIAYCPTAGLECGSKASITGKESNYDSLADQIKAANPDGIYYAGITQQQAGKLIGAIRKKGITKPFVGADGILEKAFIDDGGPAAEGVYATVAGVKLDSLGPKGQKFVKDFQAKFGNVEAYTIYGYEAMSVALSAIKTAGVKDRAAIITALHNVKDFDGVLGKWSFDKNGDINLAGFLVDQVKDGAWVEVTSVQPKPVNS
jgi:branched-chain amino acid transport system substrate-binding protein